MSIFFAGQRVICIDARNACPMPNEQWKPLVKNRIYRVRVLFGDGFVDVDGSGRAWCVTRFRPLGRGKTDIGIFRQMLTQNVLPDTRGWPHG